MYYVVGWMFEGENFYVIFQVLRGDVIEVIVLVVVWENVKYEVNKNGVFLVLILVRYFKRWLFWLKDIIIFFSFDSIVVFQVWVDVYYDVYDNFWVVSLFIKLGVFQGVIVIDYVQENCFKSVYIVYDGVNGQFFNFDLINFVVNIVGGQMGMGVVLQEMWNYNDKYFDCFCIMFWGMFKQGFGFVSGFYSSFIFYYVDVVIF